MNFRRRPRLRYQCDVSRDFRIGLCTLEKNDNGIKYKWQDNGIALLSKNCYQRENWQINSTFRRPKLCYTKKIFVKMKRELFWTSCLKIQNVVDYFLI